MKTKLLQAGKTATGIRVPEDVVTKLGGGKRPKVKATLNGYEYRTSIGSMGGHFMLPVSAEVREKAGVTAGEEVSLELVLDEAPRTVEVPPELAAALKKSKKAAAFFDTISYSNKRWYVLWLETAKKAETRAARVTKAIQMLEAGKKQG